MPELDPELVARVRAAVAALPQPERSVFALHAGARLDFPAIAERLGIGLAEVERLLASAILILDRSLPEDLADAGLPPDES